MSREQLTASLRPLVQRCHLGHCWIKTKNGPRRIDEPFDAVKLSEHVMGGNAYGLCPIAPGGSTTRVAVLDFDSHKGETPWPDMLKTAQAVADELLLDGCNPVMFRSSGGQGIHIYLVWNEPQDAYSVREMLRLKLEACGLSPGTGGVAKSEVEIFPKQNSIEVGSFGSMFVLPLSGKSEYLGGV